jgi:hypothetical protein
VECVIVEGHVGVPLGVGVGVAAAIGRTPIKVKAAATTRAGRRDVRPDAGFALTGRLDGWEKLIFFFGGSRDVTGGPRRGTTLSKFAANASPQRQIAVTTEVETQDRPGK